MCKVLKAIVPLLIPAPRQDARWEKNFELMRLFVPEGSVKEQYGLFPQRYTLEEIKETLVEYHGRRLSNLKLRLFLLFPHNTNHYLTFRFKRVPGTGAEGKTLYAVYSWDRVGF